MGKTFNSLCDSCTNNGCVFQSGIVRTKCDFYMPPQLEPDNCGNYVVQDPTTKNCESCRYYGSRHEVCNYCYECSLWTDGEITTKNDSGINREQLEDFARWVAIEIINEEMWEYNHQSFTELACRKLVKLGIMQESNGEYLYKVAEDGNDD